MVERYFTELFYLIRDRGERRLVGCGCYCINIFTRVKPPLLPLLHRASEGYRNSVDADDGAGSTGDVVESATAAEDARTLHQQGKTRSCEVQGC